LCRDIDEEAGHLVTLLEEFYFILFYFGEKSPKGDTDPNFWRKIPVLRKNESPDWAKFVATGLYIGYTINGPAKKTVAS
jgi:hypothetical protein